MDRLKLEPLQARVTANGAQREYENGAEAVLEQPLINLFDLVKDKGRSFTPVYRFRRHVF